MRQQTGRRRRRRSRSRRRNRFSGSLRKWVGETD